MNIFTLPIICIALVSSGKSWARSGPLFKSTKPQIEKQPFLLTEVLLQSQLSKASNIEAKAKPRIIAKLEKVLGGQKVTNKNQLNMLMEDIQSLIKMQHNAGNLVGLQQAITYLNSLSAVGSQFDDIKIKRRFLGLMLISEVILGLDTSLSSENLMADHVDSKTSLTKTQKLAINITTIEALVSSDLTKINAQKRLLKSLRSQKGANKALLLGYYVKSITDYPEKFKKIDKVLADIFANLPRSKPAILGEMVQYLTPLLEKSGHLANLLKQAPMSKIKYLLPLAYYGLEEALILAKKSPQRPQELLRLYKNALANLKDPKWIAKINIRIASINLKRSQMLPAEFTKHMSPTYRKYKKDTKLPQKGRKSILKTLTKIYQQFIDNQLSESSAGTKIKIYYLSLFLRDTSPAKDIEEKYAPLLAQMYTQAGQHQQAAKIYLKMHRTFSKQYKWAALAFKSLAKASKWQPDNFWFNTLPSSAQTKKMEQLANTLLTVNKNRYAPKIAVLNILNDNAPKGVAELIALSKKNNFAPKPQAIRSAVFHSHRLQDWSGLAIASGLARKLGIESKEPLLQKSMKTFQALALEKSADRAINNSKLAKAAGFYTTYIKEIAPIGEKQDAIFSRLFNLELQQKNPNSALTTAYRYLTAQPKGKARRFFIEKSLNLVKKIGNTKKLLSLLKIAYKEPQIPTKARIEYELQLAELYEKNQEFGDARDRLESILNNNLATKAIRVKSGIAAVRIDKVYGNPEDSGKILKTLSRLARNNEKVLLSAAKHAISTKQITEIRYLEKALAAQKSFKPQLIKVLAALRFINADIAAKKLLKSAPKKGLSIPEKLDSIKENFSRINSSFRAACFRPSTVCESAKSRIQYYGSRLANAVKELNFPANLSLEDEKALDILIKDTEHLLISKNYKGRRVAGQ